MKEIRQGLILGMTHRERFHKHINTAFHDQRVALDEHMIMLKDFDTTVVTVLGVCSSLRCRKTINRLKIFFFFIDLF